MKNSITACLSMLMVVLCLRLAAQPIPLDPNLRKGKLANGFTYYIMANRLPSSSVQLQLLNNVGSILEEEEERGYAHFLEHMNFNGTRHFPGNELVSFLEKAGVKFGADLNAHTSFDETVYELPLTLTDPSILNKGLEVMRDWAQGATLDAGEINMEKGVILEEKRLKSGMRERMGNSYAPLIFGNSRYAQRSAIGLDEVIKTATPEKMQRFYQKWYRPDLQALIVVGDVDVIQVEKQVKLLFSSLTMPEVPQRRPEYTVPISTKGQYLMVTDPEMSSPTIQLFSRHRSHPIISQSDYRLNVIKTLFSQMLASRVHDCKSNLENKAFIAFSAGLHPLVGQTEMFSMELSAKAGELQNAFGQARQILLQLKTHGFTQGELDRAKLQYLSSLENAVKTKVNRQSQEFLGAFKDNFLHNAAIPTLEWERKFTAGLFSDLELPDFNQLLIEFLEDERMDMLVLGPESAQTKLPDETTLKQWMKTTAAVAQSPYVERSKMLTLMPQLPLKGKIVGKELLDKDGLTMLTFNNGIRVLLKATDFKKDEIIFAGFAEGGTNSFKDAAFYEASLLSSIPGFGVSRFSSSELSRLLNGKMLNVSPYVSGSTHGISGMSSSADMETALQLLFLQFTEPRADSSKFAQLKMQIGENLFNRHLNPESVFSDTINYVLHNYDRRFLPPAATAIAGVEMANVIEKYRQFYENASAFNFVFVGDFDEKKLLPMLEQYLGALPSKQQEQSFVNSWIQPPLGQHIKKVYSGTENKASVSMIFSADFHYSALNKMALTGLGEILQMKLIQVLREKEAEVYSPSVSTSATKLPKAWFNVSVSFGCAPENVDKLIGMVEEEMNKLKTKGPYAEDILKFKAAQRKNIDLALKNNDFWLNYLLGQLENAEDLFQINESSNYLDQLNAAFLKEMASTYFSGKNVIKFILLPVRT